MNNDSNDSLSFIFRRRSVRVYSPGAIGDEMVHRLLEAAMAAPSAMTTDPWRFVVVKEPASLAKLALALAGGKMLSSAALAIVVCGEIDAALDRQLSYLLQDCSAATENLLLAATALGLGACWVGIHPNEEAGRNTKQLLSLPGSLIPMAAIALGLPGEQPEPRTRFNARYVHAEKWRE
jgi:nitroreductase